jgi:hypothetical protein
MQLQHVENFFRRCKGQFVSIRSFSGTVYEGTVTEITNDFVALENTNDQGSTSRVIVLLHSIESISPKSSE